MDSLRIGWVAAWGGAAVGAIVVGAGVLGQYVPLYLAGACLLIGVGGYWRMRWRRVAFTSPSDGPGRMGGTGPYRYSIQYGPGVVGGGLTCKLKYPHGTKLAGVLLYRGEENRQEAIRAWTPGLRSALRTGRRSASLKLFEPELRESDTLSFTVESQGDFDPTKVKLYRSE